MKIFFSIIFTAFFAFLSVCILSAQDEPFKGGSGDGFTIDTVNEVFNDITKGGNGDGFTNFTLLANFNEYSMGGNGDGFIKSEFQNQFLDFTKGGDSNGFSYTFIEDAFNLIYVGGVSDGFGFVADQDDFNHLFRGGVSDGFAFSKYGHIIYWTGNVGTGWNVAGNWANGIIPNYCNPVVIPAGVPNFPAVNAGLLRIGYYKNDGDYNCQKIKIETAAEMTTRLNCFVENYDCIINKGKFFVKNPASNAFKNLANGVILIKPNAEFIVKE